MAAIDTTQAIAVLGAGTMGAGIAQLAASAGHPVILHDAIAGAAEKGRARIAADVGKLADRGKIAREDADAAVRRIAVAEDL